MRLLILDNYDSFTYNLAHLVEKVADISFDVIKNDAISLAEIAAYDKILLSPGPGLPQEAGIMPELLNTFDTSKSILGVCLGLQAIAENYESPLKNLSQVFHGITTPISNLNNDPLFTHCPPSFSVGRYHSWVIDEKRISANLVVTATDAKGLIMGARHIRHDVRGVQFHPESILSEHGETIIKNWLNL